MFANVYHAAATNFLSKLHPMQFPGAAKKSAAAKPPKPSKPPRAGLGDEHFDNVMKRSAATLERTAPSASVKAARGVGADFHAANASADAAHVSGARSDLTDIFNARKAEVHRTFHPIPGSSNVTTSTSASAQSSYSGSGRGVQGSMFPRKAVASPSAGPRQKPSAAPAPVVGTKKPRVAQMGLFPRSAGKSSE